jgi:hypothetical protein
MTENVAHGAFLVERYYALDLCDRVDQQTTTQTEEQNVCEEEDHPPEPNSPFESLAEEVNPTEETNLMHSPTASNSYTQISTHEGMTESTQRISSREAEEEDR